MKKSVFMLMLAALFCWQAQATGNDPRPNIVWITIEDWGPQLSCYDTKGIHTPNVDKLASQGVRYNNAFTTAPVCSASRSAMMTGFYQDYIGAGQHRTYDKKPLPYNIKPIPKIFEEAGYYTCLMSRKVDVNFLPDKREDLFMGLKDWTERKPGQPFFARITFEGTHRPWKRDPQHPVDPDSIELPPFYANTPFDRRDWANGYEQMQLVDREVGEFLKRLDDEGLSDNTLVYFIADHGRCHIRGKQFLYDGGLHIPMIVRWPGKIKPGTVSDDLVSAIDICASILDAADIKAPVPLHGVSMFGKEVKKRKYIFAARDKMDETHDEMRAIRSKDFNLILNLMPERPYLQYNQYKEKSYPMLAEMNILYLQGKLTPEQDAFFAPTKPPVELYDLRKDPYELHNVANDPKYAKVKAEMLKELDNWRKNVIKDPGVAEDFKAEGVFPDKCPETSVDKWYNENKDAYDYEKYGWPSWYPTRTLEEWQRARKLWEPWVFRSPDDKMHRPNVSYGPSKH